MAQVLVIHSSLTVQVLLELELAQLGHHLVAEDMPTRVDVALIELSDARSASRAQGVRDRDPDLAIIVVCDGDPSSDSHSPDSIDRLDYPCSQEDLGRAISNALTA